MLPRRLLLAFAVSLVLHAAVLGAGAFRNLLQPAPPKVLQVNLRLPPVEIPPAEPLIKNTLDPDEPKPEQKPPEPKRETRPQPTPKSNPTKAEKRQIQAAQRKLAAHTFYPPEAIARNLEGTVHLLFIIGENGRIMNVELAASSGHTILDNAAIKAAYAAGSFPGVPAGELIRPVVFQLQ